MRAHGTLRRAPVLITALFMVSLVVGAALAHDAPQDGEPGEHPRLETIGEARPILNGVTDQGRPYRLVERRTSEGPCLLLQLGDPGESETETCGYHGLPVLAVEDASRGEQLVFGLGSERTATVEVTSAGRKARRPAVRAPDGRSRAFVMPVPGPAARREVTVVERGSDQMVERLHRFTFSGPEEHRFSSTAEREAEFDFDTR